MGLFASRQNATVEETDALSLNHLYKYPPRSGNYFGTHFIMGGERFDTPQPEAYLFGENADLNFLGSKPTPFPYPPPQATEPTKTLKSLVNIRKESVRFVKVTEGSNGGKPVLANSTVTATNVTGSVLGEPPGKAAVGVSNGYNIEFVFDADYACLITIYYFCIEDIGPNGLNYLSRDSALSSETFHFQRGVNQLFSAPHHVVYPALYAEDELTYGVDKDTLPVVIHCVVGDGTVSTTGDDAGTSRQSHATICVIDHHSDGTYALRALKQKIFVDGLCYLLQEIYGIENKLTSKSVTDEETEDNGSECVICMCDTRDTLILPCRHLCLCNSCADSLRYQANNCPICRAPFRALLQIRAVQKDSTGSGLTAGSGGTPAAQNSTDGADNIPPGYKTISLIEALNGPVVSAKATGSDNNGAATENGTDGNRNTENGYAFRGKLSKSSTEHSSNGELANGNVVSEKPTGVGPGEVRMHLLASDGESGAGGAAEGTGMTVSTSNPTVCTKKELLSKHSPLMQRAPVSKDKNPREKGSLYRIAANANCGGGGNNNAGKITKMPSDKAIGFHLVHEKTATNTGPLPGLKLADLTENDDDSDADKLAPLLRKSGSYETKKHPDSSAMKKLLTGGGGANLGGSDGGAGGNEKIASAVITELLKGAILGDGGDGLEGESNGIAGLDRDTGREGTRTGGVGIISIVADDSEDYYTPEDPPATSPLKAMDDELPRELATGQRKQLLSATVGAVPPPPSALSVLKEESSLQGSLPDSPISGNSQTSTRSSSDSYSSSSSTRQLLSSGAVPNDTPTHALSSVDSTTNGHSVVSKIAECSMESD
ncbi:probable E3 ubiquitin-protein ligase MGRN1 [Anopheles bellator]|uniref:probable E3 ubiquitin-protein ligase MGRN1 n=1 Tax=Anopheles bellator TaxID=139047 RepID=UPI0026498E69|nr:probable E3 ubiquitin-protein ligase MGRN1 [Anopheles bellator]